MNAEEFDSLLASLGGKPAVSDWRGTLSDADVALAALSQYLSTPREALGRSAPIGTVAVPQPASVVDNKALPIEDFTERSSSLPPARLHVQEAVLPDSLKPAPRPSAIDELFEDLELDSLMDADEDVVLIVKNIEGGGADVDLDDLQFDSELYDESEVAQVAAGSPAPEEDEVATIDGRLPLPSFRAAPRAEEQRRLDGRSTPPPFRFPSSIPPSPLAERSQVLPPIPISAKPARARHSFEEIGTEELISIDDIVLDEGSAAPPPRDDHDDDFSDQTVVANADDDELV